LEKGIIWGPNANGDGTWTIGYELVVTNSGDAPGTYDLSDRLQYGEGLDIEESTVITVPGGVPMPDSWTGRGPEGSPENVIATGVELPADSSHGYLLDVVVSMHEALITPSDLECPPPGSGDAGGLANTATLEHNGIDSDDAC